MILPRRFIYNGLNPVTDIVWPDIGTYTFTGQAAHNRTNEECISLTDAGTRIWLGASIHRQVRQYNMSTANDITTIGAFNEQFNPRTQDMINVLGVWFLADGTRMWLSGTGGSIGQPRIVAYTLPTTNEIDVVGTTNAPQKAFGAHFDTSSLTPSITSPQDLCVKPDGTRIIISQGVTQYQLDMSTPWDVTTITYNGVSSLTNAQQSQAYVTPDGQYMYLFRTIGTPGYVMQYPMATPWDLSTLGSVKSTLNVSAKDTIGRGLYVTPNNLYFVGQTDFFQYSS